MVFSPQLGLRCFHVKISCPLFLLLIFAEIPLLAYQEQPLQTGPKRILQKTAKILQDNSPPPIVFVCTPF